jgi:conjugal transfer ATP-binding protein TraC
MSESLTDHLQIWGFEKDFIIFSDGSLGFGLDCVPIDLGAWSDDQTNAYSERVGKLLNSLPSNLDIQFVQDIEPGNGAVIDRHESLAHESTNAVATSLCRDRAQFLRALDENGDLPAHTLKIFVRRPFSQSLLDKPKLFSREKLFQSISEERLSREVESTQRLKENLVQGLSSLEIESTELTCDQVAKLLYHQWNPSRRLPFKSYDPEEVRQSLIFSDVGIDLEGFVIGSTHMRVLSLKILPDQTYAGMASALRDLPFKSRLLVSVHVPDQMKEIASLQTQRRIAYSMVVGKKTGVSDLESAAKFQDLETLLEQMIAQGQKVFHVSVTVILQHEIESELETQIDLVLSKFRELGGAEALTETLAAFEIFSQSALPNARTKERAKKIKTSNLCDLIPLFGPWPGHALPSVVMRSRMGSLVSLNVFDPGLSNANQLIAGGSGSGKSVLTNILAMQTLKENAQITFIDIGGSYRKLTENLGGQYVELGVSDDLALNPFDLLPGEVKPTSQKIKFLVGLVELITKEDDAQSLPKLARAEIEDAVQRVYLIKERPKLSDLRDLLLGHQDPALKIYGKILSAWCGNTPYGKFLDRETTIELQNDIVAFDLKGLESFPDLQVICLYIITDVVWRQVQKDRSRKKIIVFDECWKLLKDDAGIVFIEEIFRTIRKYFGSAIAISQDIIDFLNSKIASALLPNCAVKWMLIQNQSDLSKMSQSLGLNENEVALVQSLQQEKGVYSEAFLVAGPDRRAIIVITPTPLELWIATTDPRDLILIEKTKRENPDLAQIEVLQMLADKFPHGASKGTKGKSA